jgi:hypothetical protein
MNAEQLNSDSSQPVIRGGTSFRVLAGIGLALVVVTTVAVFLINSVTEVCRLYELGIRRDALRLIAIRDLSFAAAILCGGYFLCSLIFKGRTRQRVVASVFLVVFACSYVVSGYAEHRQRSRVRANLEQLGKALEKYERELGSAVRPETGK